MNNYDFECENNKSSCLRTLRRDGICLVRNYLNNEQLLDVTKSFHDVLDDKIDGSINKYGHPTNKGGRQATIDLIKAKIEGAGIFEEIAHSNLIKNVSELYYEPHKCNIAANVLITHLKACPTPILPWHYDRLQTLKFWIYLKDATVKNGAFEYCPGTHWEGRYRASYNLAIGKCINQLPNDLPDYRITNPVSLEARAGDLIIFDPDGFHRGGVVTEGHERLVLRIDTYPSNRRESFDRVLSKGWFLQSSLNLAKKLKSSSSRILGDVIKDSSINRNEHSIR